MKPKAISMQLGVKGHIGYTYTIIIIHKFKVKDIFSLDKKL